MKTAISLQLEKSWLFTNMSKLPDFREFYFQSFLFTSTGIKKIPELKW